MRAMIYRNLSCIIIASAALAGTATELSSQEAAISEIAEVERAVARYYRTKFAVGTIIILGASGSDSNKVPPRSPADIEALKAELGASLVAPSNLPPCDGETRTNCFDFSVTFGLTRIQSDSAVVEIYTRVGHTLTLRHITLTRRSLGWEVVRDDEIWYAVTRPFGPP